MSTRAATVSGAASAAQPSAGRRAPGSSSLARNWHGLPVWAWVLGGTVVGYLVWTKVHKSSSGAAPTYSGAPATGGTAVVTTGAPPSGGGSGGGSGGNAGGTPVGGSGGTVLGTTPAPAAQTPVAGTFQVAPTGSVFASGGKVYSPIQSWQQTLRDAARGVAVFLRTTRTGQPYPVTLAQLKAIEHTGTHAFPQYVTYTTSASGGASTSAVTPGASTPRTIPTSVGTAQVITTRSGQKLAAVSAGTGVTYYPNTAATRARLGK